MGFVDAGEDVNAVREDGSAGAPARGSQQQRPHLLLSRGAKTDWYEQLWRPLAGIPPSNSRKLIAVVLAAGWAQVQAPRKDVLVQRPRQAVRRLRAARRGHTAGTPSSGGGPRRGPAQVERRALERVPLGSPATARRSCRRLHIGPGAARWGRRGSRRRHELVRRGAWRRGAGHTDGGVHGYR